MNNIQIRRKILQILYEAQNSVANIALEHEELADKLGITLDRIQSNLAYLGDPEKALIRQTKTSVGGRIYHFVQITAAGIDLLDDPNEFNTKFPPQIIYQQIAGDNLEITVGDNASHVTVGKDIIQVEFGSSHNIREVCDKVLNFLVDRISEHLGKEVAEKLIRLQQLLLLDNPDLGEIQRIKLFLIESEKKPAIGTTTLFSHPEVVEPIKRAVDRLIGHS